MSQWKKIIVGCRERFSSRGCMPVRTPGRQSTLAPSDVPRATMSAFTTIEEEAIERATHEEGCAESIHQWELGEVGGIELPVRWAQLTWIQPNRAPGIYYWQQQKGQWSIPALRKEEAGSNADENRDGQEDVVIQPAQPHAPRRVG